MAEIHGTGTALPAPERHTEIPPNGPQNSTQTVVQAALFPCPRQPATGARAPKAWRVSGERSEPLGKHAKTAATAGQSPLRAGERDAERERREKARAEKFDARRRIGPVSTLKRLAQCGRVSMAEDGVVHLRAGTGPDGCGRAGLGGLVTCGSVWACPVCSAKITAERAVELTKLITWNADRGGSVGLLTLTMQHHAGHRLRELRRGLTKAWRHMTSSRTWKEDRQLLGMDGYVRAIEATHGRHNGWHLHIHCLLIFNGPVDLMQVLVFQEAIWQLWRTGLERQGFTAIREHAVDLRMGEHALEKLGSYINKLAFEAVGGRFKKGHQGGRTPFEILAEFLATGLADDYDLWSEWEQGSKGMRQLVWSQGLKARICLQDVADEEIAEAAEEGTTVAVLPARTWHQVYPVVEQLLTVTERGGPAAALAWLDERQLPYDRPEPPDGIAVPPSWTRTAVPQLDVGDRVRRLRHWQHERRTSRRSAGPIPELTRAGVSTGATDLCIAVP